MPPISITPSKGVMSRYVAIPATVPISPDSQSRIVNLSGRGMLLVSVARPSSGRGTPLLTYCAAPLKPSGVGKRRPGPLS